ncbi:hypothetical protein HZ996_05280 [Cryomorphaceae bacterium]|nr:hypothetical protein HZ996_05280 [Cryomorphaceae bacterium]
MKYQSELLELWKNRLPDTKEAAKVLSETLHVSLDSAYRRLRGDTALSFDEGMQLMQHAGLSNGALTGGQSTHIAFQRLGAIDNLDRLREIYSENDGHISALRQEDGHMLYMAKDIPIFYNFLFGQIGGFKSFVWAKSLYNFSDEQQEVYSEGSAPEPLLQAGQQMALNYQKLSSTEFWTDSTISSVLKQLKYYYEMGAIKTQRLALSILDDVRKQVDLVIEQAKLGQKINPATGEPIPGTSFKLYYHELLVMDNSVLGLTEDRKLYFAPYSGLNYLSTVDQNYCGEIEKWAHDQMDNSILLSKSSSKERVKFHRRLHQQIDSLYEYIKYF